MADTVIFGKRRKDFSLMIDFKNRQAAVQANTAWIEGGVALEPIPLGRSGYRLGMVLVKHGWRKQYFLVKRDDWTTDEYFQHAKKLMEERGIETP